MVFGNDSVSRLRSDEPRNTDVLDITGHISGGDAGDGCICSWQTESRLALVNTVHRYIL